MTDDSDRIRIHELINLHGHLVDEGEFGRLDELMTDDIAYDLTAYGGGVLTGWEAVAEAGRALGAANPVGHHVTNIVVEHLTASGARARSKGLAVMADGSAGSVVYVDELRRTTDGWRIARRQVFPRRVPLEASGRHER